MIMVRFAISLFALALLGMAFSMSAVSSQPEGYRSLAATVR